MGSPQHRKYLLTIQNPVSKGYTHEAIKMILATMNVTYFCLADETAPTTGTPHTHVFIYRKSAIREDTIRRKFPDTHFDACLGTCQSCRDYVSKSGKWADSKKAETNVDGSFEEIGTMPTEREEKAPEMSDIIQAVEAGNSTAAIIRDNPKYMFRSNDINTLRETLTAESNMNKLRDVNVYYLFGPTGTGKTSSIYQTHKYGDICRITTYPDSGIRFDGYHGQAVLVFEEFASQVPIEAMLNYLDHYPVYLPARYSDRVACYETVYITSNRSLAEQYSATRQFNPEVWRAFLRRITGITEFCPNGIKVEHTKGEYMP